MLKRKTALRTRSKLRVEGRSETAEIKREIQAVAREIVILRDGGCILRNDAWRWAFFGVPECNGYRKDGALILQADHLITRANSATYADTRLIVALCKGHHGWKSVGGNARKAQYDDIVKQLLPADRVVLWERAEADSWRPKRTYAADWKLELVALKAELAAYQQTA